MISQSSEDIEKKNLIELAWILNDLVMDLKTPTDIIKLAKDNSATNLQIMSIIRMTLCALIINLSKLLEVINFYGKYIRSFPPELCKELNGIKREIEVKGIYEYRNTYIAHAFMKEKGSTQRPLMLNEASSALMKIIDEGLNPVTENAFFFSSWVYEKNQNVCVVKVIERTVKEIERRVGGLGSRI